MSEIILPEFNLRSIIPDQVNDIVLRLTMLNTGPTRASVYLVAASPVNAKSHARSHTITTWPEVVLGMIAETEGDGSQTDGNTKSWNLFPSKKTGLGWRKKSIMMVRGRSYAANCLLYWWADENQKRLNLRGIQ